MEKFLTINEVTKIVGFKKSTIYKFIKNNAFPRPIKIGKSSRWLLSDINNWINQFKEETMT
jgi:prophage regulatory protein